MTVAALPRYESDRIPESEGDAVVVGAGIAGLLAARVLADAFERVTVIERDPLPDEPAPRRGVPQDVHVHVLLEGGRITLEDLFPGFSTELHGAGGVVAELGRDVKLHLRGGFLAAGTNPHELWFATRPLYEHLIRRRVTTLNPVTIRSHCRFVEFLVDDTTAVNGVAIRNRASEREELPADLVVDATGRTSRTPTWLAKHGYTPPPLDEIRIDLGYGSTFVERPPDDTRSFLMGAEAPQTRGAFVNPVEGNRWHVNVHGMHGDHPPADPKGFEEFAASLPTDDVKDVLDEHSMVSEIATQYPFPSNRRYRYEELDRFPNGLLVVGDAIASYNPIYGTGMSAAALQALALHHALISDDRTDLALGFFDRAAAVIDVVWDQTLGSDSAFPQTDGPNSREASILDWYVNRLFRRAQFDDRLSDAAFQVISLQQAPTTWFRPRVVWHVVRPARGSGTA
jgi:flavin-dependent dehydrogenase